MEKLKASVDKFNSVREKYSHLGANDPEPYRIFQEKIRKFLESGDIDLPNKKEWQVFDLKGSYSSAQELSFGLLGVIAAISRIKRYESDVVYTEAIQYLKNEIL